MTKQTNEPTNLSSLRQAAAPHVNGAQGNGEMQLSAFRDLALRIHTDLSVQRFEAALRALLLPMKKRREARALPPTHNPES